MSRSRNPSFARVRLVLLYLFMIAGGLWHLLGWFQTLMRVLAAPLLLAIALLLSFETLRHVEYAKSPRLRRHFILWSLFVVLAGYLIELLGVRTGVIFGNYRYLEILQPQIADVPVVIGFAWLSILMSAWGVADKILRAGRSALIMALMIALLMALFDALMEPAAIYLRYWTWLGNAVPLQNYLAWFIIGFLFAWLATANKILPKKAPPAAWHAFLAQILYFGLIHAKTLLPKP